MKKAILSILLISFSITATAVVLEQENPAEDVADTYAGKPASKHTIAANAELAKRLPFDDMTAFEEQSRGLIASFGEDDAGGARWGHFLLDSD
jgi:alkyl sulfatase BDS1-like metallo-beta-lactamase superfamily hydrolase